MTGLEAMPWWIALPVSGLVLVGSVLTLLGTLGLVRLSSFYDRIHAPTLGTSWGAAAILLASAALFTWHSGQPSLREAVLGLFLMVTTPVTMMMLGRAALHRDRAEGSAEVPPRALPEGAALHPAEQGSGQEGSRPRA